MISAENPAARTLKKIESLKNLISIPKIILEVNHHLSSDPGNMVKLGKLISRDQGLTTKVVAVANSPLYGLQRKVTSIEFALMIMGTDEIQRIVTAVSLSDSLKFSSNENFNYLDYWKHSMVVGAAAKDISIRLGFSDLSGEAFLAGMLHDVGMQIIAQYFPNEYVAIIDASKNGRKFFDAEKEILGVGHDFIGKELSLKWKLPESISEAIEHHHLPSSSAKHKVLSSIVHLADSMTQEFHVGDCFWDKQINFDIDVVELLKFKSAELMARFVGEYNEIFIDTAESINL
ncbi:MAG: HDOD domain-containing protein [Melioribacteraceae bacterium]|nr:HDOD domain-containing protein [Melioribacteraceae bacterium]